MLSLQKKFIHVFGQDQTESFEQNHMAQQTKKNITR
jgi:hypothetical protein